MTPADSIAFLFACFGAGVGVGLFAWLVRSVAGR